MIYEYSEKEMFSTYGTSDSHKEKDLELFRQRNSLHNTDFKSLKQIKLCEGSSNIYTHGHNILAESACIYEVNSSHTVFLDPVDYLTHEIYFTCSPEPKIYSCLGEKIASTESTILQINVFDYLKDVDYFVKHTEALEKKRADEIEKIEKGDQPVQ